MADIAYVNGEFSPLTLAKISISDRGLLFGDAVYEVIRAFNGNLFLGEQHFERLRESLQGIKLDAAECLAKLPGVIAETLRRNAAKEALVYIQISRGTQPRNLIFDSSLTPNVIVTVRDYHDTFERERREGISVGLAPDIRWRGAALKTTNLLPNVLLRNEAREQGHFEMALYDSDNQITECCSSSLFIIENGGLVIPPLTEAILPGVGRQYILTTLAPQLGLTVTEEPISRTRLVKAAEIFITATNYHLVPVVRVENHVIANGKPGEITKKLIAAWLKSVEQF